MSFTRSFSAQPERLQVPVAGEPHASILQNLLPAAVDPDVELAGRVSAFLRDRGVASASALDIEARKGTVHIVGRVHSYFEKQLVYHTASRVAGVLQVKTELHVIDPTADDEGRKLEPRAAWSRRFPSHKVAVAVGAWLLVAGVLFVSRGSGGQADVARLTSLSGTLLVRGVPAAGGYISLHALGSASEPRTLTSWVEGDGSFSLSYQTFAQDAPQGFVATIHRPASTEGRTWGPIPVEYTSPKSSPLRVRLAAGAENSVTFHIL